MAVQTGITFSAGVLFGLALAAPPGPMNAIIAEESILGGWIAGVRAGLGAMTADALFFFGALAGLVAVVDRLPTLRAVMVTTGGILMLYFALGAARSVESALAPEPDGREGTTGFRKALVLGLTNPYQIIFWLTVGIGLLQPGRLDVFSYLPLGGEALVGTFVVETGSAALLVGLFVGILVWVVSFPAALIGAGRRIDAFAPVVAAGSALVLAGFGILFIWDGAATLLAVTLP